MNYGRPLGEQAQAELRRRIQSQGLERVAAQLQVSPYLAAKGAAGATVAENSAFLLEMRLGVEKAA